MWLILRKPSKTWVKVFIVICSVTIPESKYIVKRSKPSNMKQPLFLYSVAATLKLCVMLQFTVQILVYDFAHHQPNSSQHCYSTLSDVVLAMGPGNPPAVQFFAGSLVQFSSRPSRKHDPLCLGGFVTWTGLGTMGFWLGWNRTTVPNTRFPHLWLQLSI